MGQCTVQLSVSHLVADNWTVSHTQSGYLSRYRLRAGGLGFSSTFSCLNCCKCEERVSWQSVVSCAPCNGIMPRSIRTVHEDDIIARHFFPPALARSTPFNCVISCELKSPWTVASSGLLSRLASTKRAYRRVRARSRTRTRRLTVITGKGRTGQA